MKTQARTYGNWRRPTSPGLLGLGALGTGLGLLGLVVCVVVLAKGGPLKAALLAFALALSLATLVIKDRHGKSLLSRASARVGWLVTRTRGNHLYRSGPLGYTPWGTCQLPGLAAATRLSEHEDSYGRRFALINAPNVGHYSVVIAAEPDGAALVDPEVIDSWVAQWGRWLAALGDEPGLEACSVTVETAPDSGTRLKREVAGNIDPEAPEFSKAVLSQIVDTYPAGSSTIKAYVTLTFAAAARAGAKKRSREEMGIALGSRLPGLTQGLAAAGAGAARPLSSQELCEAVRIAYDPAAAVLIDEAHAADEVPELRWYDVGPTAAEAGWAGYRHDSAFSVTYSMTEAPRGHVHSGVLARLLAPHPDIARKRVTLLYRPIDAAKAATLVENDLRAAQFRETSNRRAKARDTLATKAAAAAAAEEAAGAGLLNFGMLLTATVMDPAKRVDARAAVDNLAATARIRLRPVYGSQDSCFAAALPLGLVLPKHLQVPAVLKELL